MRKRAQRRTQPVIDGPKHIVQKARIEKKPAGVKKNWWVAASLLGIFLLVLFFNSYFNITSEITINPEGKDFDKYYLSGPDPYYNMRLIEETLESGRYPYYSDLDPLLNYPLGRSGRRPPLLNMAAIGFSRFLIPFMDEVDAVGYSMQFVPALFGALLVIPVYFIGKALFNKKAGLIGALFIPLIPIHLGSGHGSAYSLFDHDSLNLLLFVLTFLFLIKSIKEKETIKAVLFAILSGTSLAALAMTWVQSEFLFVVIAVYAVIQMLVDIFTNKMDKKVVITSLTVLLTGYLLYLPINIAKTGAFKPDIPFYLCIGIAVFGAAYIFFDRKKIPWTLSLPLVFGVGVIALIFLFFAEDISGSIPFLSPLSKFSDLLKGIGIYGTKISRTIAEAGAYNISRNVMSFGPAIYWLGWTGFLFLLYSFYKHNQRRDFLFMIVLFIIDMWLIGIAGRFVNDLVPLIAIFGGWVVWIAIKKIDYKQMIRNIRSAGGGIHGLRRGIKVLHLFGIIFIGLIVIFPNAYLAFDAAIPSTEKNDFFGDLPKGAYGLGVGKEAYWLEAFNWLNEQDIEIEDPVDRPAFISWWDYGFYEVAVGEHPTVADNFQDGVPPAANFHTSIGEKEAVIIWTVRLLEGNLKDNNGKLSGNIVDTLKTHVGNNSANITRWMEDPTTSPSYKSPIGEKYNEELSKEWLVGEQFPMNAVYHDIVELLNKTLDDETVTWLYHDIQEGTGYSIRYYGVEGYDKQIFNIFGFLSDKSLVLVAGGDRNPEDDFVQIIYTGYNVDPETGEQKSDGEWTADELNEMSREERRRVVITNTRTRYKDPYFETMFYKTYIGISVGAKGSKSEPNYQLPCLDMKHFYAEHISNITKYQYYQGKSAVVIARYYEGAKINGTVEFMGKPINAQVVVQKNISHYGTSLPIDHDKDDTSPADGSFNVIAPAGNITLQIRRNTELGSPVLGGRALILKNVVFNGTAGSELAPISDDEAMRKNGTDYERTLTISIDPGDLDGYVYVNNDNISAYNVSIDGPLANVNITLYEIDRFDPNTGQPTSWGSYKYMITDENGYYNVSDIMPGYYLIRAVHDDFVIHEDAIIISSGDNKYNISKPEPVTVEGKVYYDANYNTQFDLGEEMSNVDIKLSYLKLDDERKPIDITITDNNGVFSFTSLIPGEYVFNATRVNSSTGYLDYSKEETIMIERNKTTKVNISIDLAPIKLTGYTKHGDDKIGEISVDFSPFLALNNNTAAPDQVDSDKNGFYKAFLQPGTYDVKVDYVEGEATVYTYEGSLTLVMGQGEETYDISMTKHSVTVSGYTKYLGSEVGNITIDFLPDEDYVNNTARTAVVKSDPMGYYTLELMPGYYDVTVKTPVIENGQNVSYPFTDKLQIKTGQITTGFEYDIALEKRESE